MHVISFVTHKGGAGKSTLVFSTAVAAQQDGDVVAVLDLDPQASTTFWGETRQRSDLYVETIAPSALPARVAELRTAGFTLCIIDSGAEESGVEAAIAESDLCLIPARPNVFDLRAGEMTRRKVAAEGKRGVFLLNQCPPMRQSARVLEGVRTLEAAGVLISTIISARVDFQDAARAGLGVTELNPHGPAAREIRELWDSIGRLLSPEVLDAPQDSAAPHATGDGFAEAA